MRRPRRPLFLARARYRQRRLRDAARLLPVLGVMLLLVPLLWTAGGNGKAVSVVAIFFFAVWALLIALAAAFAAGLQGGEDGEDEED